MILIIRGSTEVVIVLVRSLSADRNTRSCQDFLGSGAGTSLRIHGCVFFFAFHPVCNGGAGPTRNRIIPNRLSLKISKTLTLIILYFYLLFFSLCGYSRTRLRRVDFGRFSKRSVNRLEGLADGDKVRFSLTERISILYLQNSVVVGIE